MRGLAIAPGGADGGAFAGAAGRPLTGGDGGDAAMETGVDLT